MKPNYIVQLISQHGLEFKKIRIIGLSKKRNFTGHYVEEND